MARSIGEVFEIQSWQHLDGVFESFLRTNINGGRHISWEQVRAPGLYKRYFRYEHMSVPYLATKKTASYPMSERVTIKLNCSGFTWPPPPPERCVRLEHPRDNATGWVVLPDGDFFPSAFPNIARCFDDADGVCVYYARDARRIEMKFFYDDLGVANVLVVFETGSPYYDDHLDSIYRSRWR